MAIQDANPGEALIALLYEGPVETPPFQRFLMALRDWLGADAASILVERQRRQLPDILLNVGGTRDGEARYREGSFRDDPFIELPPGVVRTFHEHLGPDGLARSGFFRDYLVPTGYTFLLGADLVEAGGERIRIRASRLTGHGDFGAAEKARLAALLPHLMRALDLFLRLSRLEAECTLYAALCSRLAIGVVLVDREGRVLEANAAAQAVLAEGEVLTVAEGRLRLVDDHRSRELAALIAGHADAASGVARALRLQRETGQGVGLIVRPAPGAPRLGEALQGAAVVIIADPDQAVAPPPQALVELFQLTPAEAELGVLLAQGLDLDEASQALGVAKNTARAQLRAIFAKTGVTRQSALVRLLLRSVDELV
ncbi:MAG: helix-turn-helix transcriptional regulator [Aliidongia sp.]